jgi:hypothetical protein
MIRLPVARPAIVRLLHAVHLVACCLLPGDPDPDPAALESRSASLTLLRSPGEEICEPDATA